MNMCCSIGVILAGHETLDLGPWYTFRSMESFDLKSLWLSGESKG
jgi:hypothetical protein